MLHGSSVPSGKSSRQNEALSNVLVCGRSAEAMLEEIERFHGVAAPGVVIGAFMVDWAQEQLGAEIEYDAVVETCRCLPDAVQLFTPCTFGNGWMRVLDWDRFALTLYDRSTLKGVRVLLDAKKAELYPDVRNWFLKRVPKHALPLDVLLGSVLQARRAVLSTRPVRLTGRLRRPKKERAGFCPGCGEAYDPLRGNLCGGCREGSYFQEIPG